MDVRCAQCGTEYELDDDRLGNEAVTVKCATCGHVFKVRKEDLGEAAAPPPTPAAPAPGQPARKGLHWMVRQQNGNVLTFKELTTLQKWIVERKVTREDEISKSGETWKRLGSIAELASFFQVVDIPGAPPGVSNPANPVLAPPPPQGGYPLPPMAPPPAPQSMPPVPVGSIPPGGMPPLPPGSLPPPHVPGQTSGSYGAYPQPYPAGAYPPGYPVYPYPPPPGMDPAAYPPGSMPPLPQGSFPPPPGQPSASALPTQPAPQAPRPAVASNATPALALPVLDEDDPVLRWQRRRRWKLALGLTTAMLGGFGTAAWVLFPAETQAWLQRAQASVGMTTSPGAVEACDTAQQELLRGTPVAFSSCAQRMDTALGTYGAVPRAQALKSLCTTLGGLALGEEKSWLQAALARPDLSAADAEALKARVDALAAQETTAIKNGFDLARAALAADETNAQAHVAVAAYYAARRAPADAVPYVKRATTLLPADDLLLSLVNAELDASAPDTRAKAFTALEGLVQKQPANVLARWRLAAWKVHANTPDMAAAVSALLKADPTHPQGLAMAAHLRGLPGSAAGSPTVPPVATPDAGPNPVQQPVAATPDAGSGKPTAEKPTTEKPAVDPDDKPKPKMSFDRLLSQAERTRDRGNSSKASGMFMKAMELEPERAEPHVGLGWCFVDQEKFSAAMGEFDRAVQLNPSYAEAYLGLGEVYKFRGDKFNAIKNYQKYLTILPDGPEAPVAKNNIAQLKGQ